MHVKPIKIVPILQSAKKLARMPRGICVYMGRMIALVTAMRVLGLIQIIQTQTEIDPKMSMGMCHLVQPKCVLLNHGG
jgi:hypothetical protein